MYKLSLVTESARKEICEVKTENKTFMNNRYIKVHAKGGEIQKNLWFHG